MNQTFHVFFLLHFFILRVQSHVTGEMTVEQSESKNSCIKLLYTCIPF